MILRQSTSKAVSFGPFLDKTDGVTLEVGLVSAIDHATTGILLAKNGGALTIRSQAVTASTYDAYGNYIVTLSTTDTNTVGILRVQFSEAATCLPVWQDFQVIEEAVYDALYAASATGVPAAGALEATSQSILTDTAEIGAAGAGLTNINLPNQTMDILGNITGNLSGSVGSVTGAVGSVTGLTASNLDATISSRMATYTQPTGFLAVTFPIGTVANTTNITAGTITTVTNLTNLPAAAALEATLTAMKGATFAGATDSLEAIRDRGDAAWVTATGFSTLVATDIVSAGAITTSGGIASADVKKINAVTIVGNGSATPFNV